MNELQVNYKSSILNKPTGFIHISGGLNTTQEKISNVLLKNAEKSMKDDSEFHIPVSKLCDYIGFNSHNIENLKDNIRGLQKILVETNILGQDKKYRDEWLSTQILGEVEIKNGILSYSYPPKLKKLLATRHLYARIDLLIQRDFTGKHAIKLWQYLCNAIDTQGSNTHVESISIENLRLILGLDDKQYPTFKDFNSRCIKSPLKEINKISNINVKVAYEKVGRKVCNVLFTIERVAYQGSLGLQDKDKIEGNKEVEDEVLEYDPVGLLIKQMVAVNGVSEEFAKKAVAEYGRERIQKNLDAVDESVKRGVVKNITAFTTQAINDNYQPQNVKSKNIDAKIIDTIETVTQAECCDDRDLINSWKKVHEKLKDLCGDAAYYSWLKSLHISELSDGYLLLYVPTNFIRDWVISHYYDDIEKLAIQELGNISTVDIQVFDTEKVKKAS